MTNTTESLADALVAAQAEMKNPAFDTTNPHFRSKFASLAAVRAAVLPVLNKHGIALTQNLTTTERGVACTTTLTKGGESMAFGPFEIPAAKMDGWSFGSAGTYARRYSVSAALFVVGDDDDDASAASKTDPMDRESLTVNAKHETYAQAFRKAVADGNDLEIVHLRDDCNGEGEEFFRAVWSLLDSKTRTAINKALARIKNA